MSGKVIDRLPTRLIERGTKLATEIHFMGHRLDTLTREELLAVAALGWEGEYQARKELRRRTAFMGDLMKSALR